MRLISRSRSSVPENDCVSDLQRLLQRLDDAGIPFVLVGGYAAMLHGSSLLTRDVDVCAVLTPPNIAKLRDAFRDFHPVHRLSSPQHSFLDVPEPGAALDNLYLNTDLGTLDLLGRIKGVGNYERVARDAIEIDLFGHRVRAISLDDLIAAKEALGRDKDLISAKELRAIREKLRGG
jgi:predicted nucleotidyltransferase